MHANKILFNFGNDDLNLAECSSRFPIDSLFDLLKNPSAKRRKSTN